jgi:hypothetical protein
VYAFNLNRHLGRAEMKANLVSMQRGTNEIYNTLAEKLDKLQPSVTTIPTTNTSDYETNRLEEAVQELEQRVKDLKRGCDLRDAIIGTYQQRELGHSEEARAEFHRALQLANSDNSSVWTLEYKVPSNLWVLAAPRFKIYRDKAWGLTAKEVRFASTK